MGLSIKVIAFGFGALSLALGAGLLGLAFNYTTDSVKASQEMQAGWVFVSIGVVVWILSFAKSMR